MKVAGARGKTEAAIDTERVRPPLTLCVLGPFSLTTGDGRTITVTSRKYRALLAVLAASPGRPVSRDRICGLLWADFGQEQARSSLRQALASLRRELGDDSRALRSSDQDITLEPSCCSSDISAFLTLSRSGSLEDLAAANSLYRGDFLMDHGVPDASFEDWCSSERRRLAEISMTVLEALSAQTLGSERIGYARSLVERDPLRESSHRILARAYLAVGDKALALRQLDACESLLSADLGVAPAPETQALRREILAMGSGPMNGAATHKQAKALHVAVIPFTNLSSDPQQQYLADGISEDIITGLGRFRHISVTARHSSFRFRGDVDVAAAGQSLNVSYIVSGSLRRSGQRLRITVQLIAADTGIHHWGEAYDIPGDEVFTAIDEAVQRIVTTLGGRIADAGVHHARLKPPNSLAAYELMLRANALDWESREAKAEARRMLEQALAIDSGYATAHSLLAAVSLRDAAYHARLTRDVLDTCLRHARRAVEISGDDSSCHSILGWVLIARGEFDLAAEHLGHAEQLNPHNPFVIVNRGSLLNQTGQPDAAIACFERVQSIDPYFNPSWLREKFGLAHFLAGRYAGCIEHLSRASKLRFYMQAMKAAAHAMLDDAEHSAISRTAALRDRPDCTAELVLSLIPLARQQDRDHISTALARAGFSDAQVLERQN